MANELIQKKTGSATDFELVPKGSSGDVVTQGPDGKHVFQSAKVPGMSPYHYDQVAAASPGSGFIRLNHTSPELATKAYISKTNAEGSGTSVFLGAIGKSDAILITDQSETTNFYYYGVNLSVDQGSYYELDIILLGFGGTLTDQSKVLLTFSQAGETNWQYWSQQVAVKDGSPTFTMPQPTDVFTFYDSNGNVQITQLRDMIASSRVDGFIHNEDSGIVTTASYQPLAIFTNGAATHFYSTIPSITKAIDHTGIETTIPVRYRVVIVGSLAAANVADFTFAVMVNGTEVPLQDELTVSGDGNGKDVPFTLQALTGVLSAGDKIQLGVKNNGDTLTRIQASMWMEFAGVL